MTGVTHSGSAKRNSIAYLLWFFFGAVGAHKFYLGRAAIGLLYAGGWLSFWVLVFSLGKLLAGAVPAILLSIALLVDLFTIPRQVRAANGEGRDATEPAGRKSLFAPREDAPFDAATADAMIARYMQQRQVAAAPVAASMRAPGARPAFGKR